MSAYYNENNPYAAQWLRNLAVENLIAPGDIDERSIGDVSPFDLHGYTQHHFFAGIGGWSLALRLAGWPDDEPVWTGSCPCQPFSNAGEGRGFDDERHLWPLWHFLIEQYRPAIVFGEQVEAAVRHGWLDLVQTDMEGIGYAFAAAVIPAASVGAPHTRKRLWFVGSDSDSSGSQRKQCQPYDSQASFRHEEFARLVQSEIQLSVPAGKHGALVDGVSGRMGQIHAYGNAIVPQVAAQFVLACRP